MPADHNSIPNEKQLIWELLLAKRQAAIDRKTRGEPPPRTEPALARAILTPLLRKEYERLRRKARADRSLDHIAVRQRLREIDAEERAEFDELAAEYPLPGAGVVEIAPTEPTDSQARKGVGRPPGSRFDSAAQEVLKWWLDNDKPTRGISDAARRATAADQKLSPLDWDEVRRRFYKIKPSE